MDIVTDQVAHPPHGDLADQVFDILFDLPPLQGLDYVLSAALLRWYGRAPHLAPLQFAEDGIDALGTQYGHSAPGLGVGYGAFLHVQLERLEIPGSAAGGTPAI